MSTRLYNCLVSIVITLLCSCGTAPHKEESEDAQVLPSGPVTKYEQQKQKLINRDPGVDFTTFRWAFRDSASYKAWDTTEHEANIAMLNAIEDENYDFCIKLATAILKRNYTSLSGHLGMHRCSDAIADHSTADFHGYVIAGIIASIEASGDGLSAETAFVTTTPNEMRGYLLLKGFTSFRQELASTTGRYIEKIHVVDIKTSELKELYFDNSASLLPTIQPSLPSFN